MVSPWKAALATMIIFVCGLVTGVLIEKTTVPAARLNTGVDGVAPSVLLTTNLPLAVSNSPSVVTRTNLVWAPFQAQRMAFIRQMVNRLNLEPAQRERVQQIIKASQERNKALWEQIAPQMREELKRVTGEIRQELDPQQQRRFMELRRENRRDNRGRNLGTNTPATANKATND